MNVNENEGNLRGLIAEGADAMICNHVVAGSSPAAGTSNSAVSKTWSRKAVTDYATGSRPEDLRERFVADPETGLIFRKDGRRAFAAKRGNGYLCGLFNGRLLLAHRVLWALVHGRFPVEIDHINGQRDDNRLSNLREVERGANTRNKALQRNNTSGVQGVTRKGDRWQARIGNSRTGIRLGTFATFDEAVAARKAAEAALGYHPNHGRAL